jgi:hypothetical protein
MAAASSAATAAGGWKPFATATDSSEYGAYVSASATETLRKRSDLP